MADYKGHLTPDPMGLRYCINSLSLSLGKGETR
jgi:peptide methionine sulfoxide reductase MsrB